MTQLAARRPRFAYLAAFALLMLALVIVRFSIITSPPYYDFATGLFLEANFLADTNFDYGALTREQSRWLEGGAAVYITSIMPTLVALLMKTLPDPRSVFIAYHLFNFACAAAVVLLLFALLQPRIGLAGAVLTGAMLITAPLFSTQIDMLGMDLPMAAFALAAALFLARGQFLPATLAGFATGLIKTPGRAATGAILVYLFLLLLLSGRQEPPTRRRLWFFFGLNLLVVAFQEFQASWVSDLPQSKVENWSFSKKLFGGENMLRWTPKWFPDQVAIFAFSALACLTIVAVWFAYRLKRREPLRRALYQAAQQFAPLIFGWIVVAAVLTALAIVYCLPRYFMLVVPFVYLAFGWLLFAVPRLRPAATVLSAGLVLFNLANAYGRFYPAIPEAGRTGAILERSREYLADHKSNILAVRLLATQYPNATVIAATPFVHFLSLPRLGYVDRPMHGYSLNRFQTATFVSGMRLPDDLPRDVIFIYANNPFSRGVIPPPRAGDQVIYHDDYSSPLLVYERRWSPKLDNAALRGEYELLVMPSEGLIQVARQLAQSGQYPQALELFQRALAIDVFDPQAHFGIGYVLVKQHKPAEGIPYLRTAIRLDPKLGQAYGLLGAALAEMRQYAEAVEKLQTAVELDPTDVVCWITLGKVYLVQGQRDEATRYFDRALALRPDDNELRRQIDAIRHPPADTRAPPG